MKYPSIIFLLYCIEIGTTTVFNDKTTIPTTLTLNETGQDNGTTNSQTVELTSINSHITNEQPSVSQTSDNHNTSPPHPHPSQTPNTTSHSPNFRKEHLFLIMVAGGLIIVCTILLISTFFLACKVCQLRRRVKMLSSNSDLISNAEYWLGTAKKNENKPETEAKETTVLMSDLGQTSDEAGDSSSKEEKGNKEGHKETAVSENGGEGGDAAKVEDTSAGEYLTETPATIAEDSCTSKPQNEVGDSQSTKAEENKDEAKDAA